MSNTPPLAKLARSGAPIGVGVVGLSAAGSWAGLAHVPALRAVDGFELRALSASSAESAARAGEVHGVPLTFGSAAELAACEDVDLVVVAVRVPQHRELVHAALEAGKAVLCEWPLGNGLAEATGLEAAAREAGVPTLVGLQARSHPAIRYLRDLIAEGYVGEVLSTTVVGSGGAWGARSLPGSHYLLDPANGATMLTIPFSHTLDGVASVLGEPRRLRVAHTVRRAKVVDSDTGELIPMTAPDQVVASGRFDGGAVLTVHYRGGQCRGTSFRWEINGTEGDLLVTAPDDGHLQLRPLTLVGGRGEDTGMSPLPVPERYAGVAGLDPVADSPAYAVAHAYRQFHSDLVEGTALAPDFAHAVARHRSVELACRRAASNALGQA